MTSPQPFAVDGGAGLALLLDRRSVAALTEPGPTPEQVDVLVRAAATVPDHGALRPWRFVFVEGAGRQAFGDALARSAALGADPPAAMLERLRQKAFVAPAQLLVIASPRPGAKVAEWEQVASAACTGFAINLAASALGLGSMWKSVPFTRGVGLTELLGLTADEQLLGWVNLGTPAGPPAARAPIDPADHVTVLRGPATSPYPSHP